MKNRVLLENYYLPGYLEHQIKTSVEYYNNERYHESLNNVTPADVYFGRGKEIIRERKAIKRSTINPRRLQHYIYLRKRHNQINNTNQSLNNINSRVPIYPTTDISKTNIGIRPSS